VGRRSLRPRRVVSASGAIQLQATSGARAIGKIVVTGAIGDWGTTRTMDTNCRTDPDGNLVDVKLTKGRRQKHTHVSRAHTHA
jgi:hypothetical protein